MRNIKQVQVCSILYYDMNLQDAKQSKIQMS